MNIGFISLGCCKNRIDTEVMIGILKQSGHHIVDALDRADLIIINTCGFIPAAKEEAINTIISTGARKKDGLLKYLIATGCLAQRYGRELLDEMPELDGVVGISSFRDINRIIEEITAGHRIYRVGNLPVKYEGDIPRILTTPAGSAYIKVADGCDNCCSYCAIPLIRGKMRSKPLEQVEDEANLLAEQGVKELVVVAQDTATYGQDLYGRAALPDLLQRLNAIDGIDWIRLLYLHPAHIDAQIIASIAGTPKVVPYLDLPIQHASTSVLKCMNRRHDRAYLENLVNQLRQNIPGLVLRTTVMVGFPGETEDEFQQLLDFIKETRFDWLGAFQYAAEEGTVAATLDHQINDEIKKERYDQVLELQKSITRQKNIARLNRVEQVLISSHLSDQLYIGRGYYQAPEVDGLTVVKSAIKLKPGKMVKAKLKAVREYDLIGEIYNEPS